MEPGMHGETIEEVQQIVNDAEAGSPPTEQVIKKRKTKETKAAVWAHFTKGEVLEDGSYTATCLYCGRVYPMGNQRGTGNMRNHIRRGCKKIPAAKRHNPIAFQKLLQIGKDEDGKPIVDSWVFDQKKSRKNLARCVTAHEYPFNCENHYFFKVDAPYKKPAWDVETRWNSTYLMLQLALQLKEAINRCKLHVVEYYFKMLHPEECSRFIENLKTCLNQLFKEYSDAYNKSIHNQPKSSSANIGSSSSSSSSMITDTRAGLQNFLSDKRTAEPNKTEIEHYLSDALDDTRLDAQFDCLAWWKLKSPKYPILAGLARDILAVPISTVASESTFSTAGRVLNPIRSSLNDESLEALICAQDWLRASVIETGGVFGDVLWSSDEPLPSDDTICGSAAITT
ncbi:hypothetical protein LUZ61_001415 [Rhynchospora tenuis]|uniref:BED-type domain-containing protein n=1 Tax=Rhynchospora tenuis TaxID=198213 RepID=A0AAD5ZH28_9POAL|nr:hypothetical protein LUZ61_001415 [Rhynchospora tenuis]